MVSSVLAGVCSYWWAAASPCEGENKPEIGSTALWKCLWGQRGVTEQTLGWEKLCFKKLCSPLAWSVTVTTFSVVVSVKCGPLPIWSSLLASGASALLPREPACIGHFTSLVTFVSEQNVGVNNS